MSVSNAVIYFICYETLKELLQSDGVSFRSYNIFLASSISKGIYLNNKVIATSATYPLVVIRTVLHDHKHSHNGTSVDQKLSFMDVYRHIKAENGWKGFYSGLKPDLMRLIPSNAILFICYEYTRIIWKKYLSNQSLTKE